MLECKPKQSTSSGPDNVPLTGLSFDIVDADPLW